MRKFLSITAILLSGCETLTVPPSRHFPEAPDELKVPCPSLKQTDNTDKLSDVITVVVDNYGQYKECRLKVDAWVEWYSTQKQIFESVK